MPVQISVLKNNTDCIPKTVSSMEELADILVDNNTHGWSPGIFNNNYRNLTNFKEMHVIALDFDEGMSIVEAELMLSGYRHVIATTRNHQKEKKLSSGKIKPACDRFRVVLALSAPITSNDVYVATFNELRTLFPAADSACSDASRFFYPCVEVVSGSDEGQCITPAIPKVKPETAPKRVLTEEERGKLSRSTLEFIAIGPKENRNRSAFKAAKDLQEQGYDQEEAEVLLTQCPTLGEPGFELKDLQKAIKQAYKREPRYEPRSVGGSDSQKQTISVTSNESKNGLDTNQPNTQSFSSIELLEEALAHLANPEAVKGISTGWAAIDKVLGGLRQSELGILQAYPKSGKTVFLTNLMSNLTMQGHKVAFASLEMHPAKQVEPDLYSILLKKDIRQGVTDEDKTRIIEHLNGGRGLTYFKRDRRPTAEEICDWARRCYFDQGIRFFFFDHFHKFVSDESSVTSIGRAITALTGLKYECPEMCQILIVQPTKEQRSREGLAERVGKNTLRGGAIIYDECDWLINMHTKYQTYRENETTWGWKREYFMQAYPNDIRELEFEAIRAKPFSENMGQKIHMKYDKNTTEMSTYKFIAPEPERNYMPERDDDGGGSGYRRRYSKGNGEQSGWAKDTWDKKKI